MKDDAAANVTSENATIRDALTGHYVAHGLPADGGEHESWFGIHIGPLTIRLPNPPARRRAVFFHDTNHVLTGYNTTFSDGEMTIAAFEVGAGCGAYGIAWFINLSMLAIGLLMRPRAVYAAFVRGRHSKSLYETQLDRPAIAAMPVGHLRTLLQIHADHQKASVADIAAFLFWSVVAAVVLLLPAFGVFILIWFATRFLRA